MVTNTWIAAGPGDWDDDANWSLGHSPIEGEDPTFDGTSVNNCAANDDTPTGVLIIAAGYSGTITQSSDMYIQGFSMSGGTFTGAISKWMYLSNGSIIVSGGTVTSTTTRLHVIGDNSVIGSFATFHSLWISANCSYAGNAIANGGLTVDAGKTMTLTGNTEIRWYQNYGGLNNYGIITGTADKKLSISLYNADVTGSVGDVRCPLRVSLVDVATRSYKMSLNNTWSIQSDLIVISLHATYTITLDLNGHNLTASSITVGNRGILQCGEGTVQTKVLDSSAGTIIEETATWIFERGSTIKVAAAQKLYNVIAKGSSALKLLSNLGISELFAHPAEIDRNGFTLTLDQPDKEYAGLRRPIIVPVKKLDIGEVGLLDSWLRDLGGLL